MTRWRTWDEVKAEREAIHGPVDPELRARARAEIEAEIAGYELMRMREELRVSQTELAKRMQVSPERVNDIEKGEFPSVVGYAIPYVQALGGKIKITADFRRPGHRASTKVSGL